MAVGSNKGITLEELVSTWVACDYGIKATARKLGCDHANVSRRLKRAVAEGDPLVDPKNPAFNNQSTSPSADKILNAREEMGLRSKRKRAKGDWRKPSLINIPGSGPVLLGIMGDPHLDNPGTDLDMFEREISRRNPEERIYTACGGDFFDNWPRAMGHLYAETGDPEPAWIVFEDMMRRHPFLFSVSGNHDQFQGGTANVLDVFMRGIGSHMRRSGGRFVLNMGQGEPITIAMRHIWRGNSQYSEAHNLKRAATFGHTEDDLIAGFHTHQGELRTHIRPYDGKVSKLAQVSAFKRLDNYANDRGFMSAETPPYVWCVLDDREPVTSHARVQMFYDFEQAQAMREHQRGKNNFS